MALSPLSKANKISSFPLHEKCSGLSGLSGQVPNYANTVPVAFCVGFFLWSMDPGLTRITDPDSDPGKVYLLVQTNSHFCSTLGSRIRIHGNDTNCLDPDLQHCLSPSFLTLRKFKLSASSRSLWSHQQYLKLPVLYRYPCRAGAVRTTNFKQRP